MTAVRSKGVALSDQMLEHVSGGVVTDGYYEQLRQYMRGFAAEGGTLEEMIADLSDERDSAAQTGGKYLPDGMVVSDYDSIIKFVRSNWPKA